jgi:UDP-glucuronate decarboxylase
VIDRIILEDLKKIKQDLRKSDFEYQKILVTGGAGFIGSWICDILASFNAEITCLDNLSTGKMEYIDHLLNKPKFLFFNGDVCTFKSNERYNLIFHLASHASPGEYQQNPIETLRANSLGSQNMAELARRLDATVLFASTSEIYGDAKVIPTPETYWGNVNPVGPRACYFEGKRFAESLFMAYSKQYGLDIKIARVFNSYGPRLRENGLYGRVVSRFIVQALTNQPITVYGNGKQTRSFCYVTDTISGLILLTTSKKACGKVVNIGNFEEITVLELAESIKKLTNSQSPLTFHTLPEDDPKRRCPDISLAKKLLDWEPKVSLREGLKRTITWFQEKIKQLVF